MSAIQSSLLSIGVMGSLGVGVWSYVKCARAINKRHASLTEKVKAAAPYALLSLASLFVVSRGKSYLPRLTGLDVVSGIALPLIFFVGWDVAKKMRLIIDSREYPSWTAKLRAMAPYFLLIGATYVVAWQIGKYRRNS